MNKKTGLLFFCSLLVQLSFQWDPFKQLIQIQTITRNGERNPHETHGFFPDEDNLSQLTKNGINQMKEFGTWLKNTYKHLLPEIYHKEDISIISSYTNRTILSAHAAMSTLFSDEFVPIQRINPSDDFILAMTGKCPAHKKLLRKETNISDFQFRNELNKPIFKLFRNKVQPNVGFKEAFNICDTLDAMYKRKFKMPRWMNREMFETCNDVMFTVMRRKYVNVRLSKYQGGPLAVIIIDDMVKRAVSFLHKKPGLKMIGYFGHDTTIAAVMVSFLCLSDTRPSYGSSVIFELYFDRMTNMEMGEPMSQFFVRILYKTGYDDKPEAKRMPFCLQKNGITPTICRLDILQKRLQNSSFIKLDAACMLNNKLVGKKKLKNRNVKTRNDESVSAEF